MAARYRVLWHVDARGRFRRRPLTALVRRVLRAEGVAGPIELSIAVTDDETVRELNRRYRGVDAPTDVLSFSLQDDSDGDESLLGELVIALPTAQRQAVEQGHSLEEELAHLLVHGLLHLLGYDHERPAEARRMRAREEALLGHAVH